MIAGGEPDVAVRPHQERTTRPPERRLEPCTRGVVRRGCQLDDADEVAPLPDRVTDRDRHGFGVGRMDDEQHETRRVEKAE